jgi:hypothetical protein
MELAYFTCKHNPLSEGDEHPDTQMWQAGKYLLVEGKSSNFIRNHFQVGLPKCRHLKFDGGTPMPFFTLLGRYGNGGPPWHMLRFGGSGGPNNHLSWRENHPLPSNHNPNIGIGRCWEGLNMFKAHNNGHFIWISEMALSKKNQVSKFDGLSCHIWVNYNISPTWIVGPFGDDFPQSKHDFQWGRTVRSL